ncbi:MAG: hypothetical protein ACFB4I_16945 [Cyanophyceae cyanobacterium]
MIQNPQAERTIAFQELAIAVTAKNFNPTMLSVEFLKASGIIPSDWETAKPPVINSRNAQLNFKNGVSIVAQPQTVIFAEAVALQNPQARVPAVARQYVDKLPHASYQAVSIAPKSIVTVGSETDAAKSYITSTLLSPGPWRDYGNLAQASITLLYHLEQCQLSLNVNEIKIKTGNDKPTVPAVLFAGSFNYSLAKYPETERLTQIQQRIESWATDLKAFQDLIKQKFLGEAESVFPSEMMS